MRITRIISRMYKTPSKMLFVERVPYPYPNSYKMWSNGIFRGLSFYGINSRRMRTKRKMAVVIVDKVLFDEVLDNVISDGEL